MRKKTINNDDIKFDLTLLSNSDRRLCSLILGMYFNDQINFKQLIYYIDLYKLPIIKY